MSRTKESYFVFRLSGYNQRRSHSMKIYVIDKIVVDKSECVS